jgi:hypothetical protein
MDRVDVLVLDVRSLPGDREYTPISIPLPALAILRRDHSFTFIPHSFKKLVTYSLIPHQYQI